MSDGVTELLVVYWL